jgi:glucose/arabinose dehydrogenase
MKHVLFILLLVSTIAHAVEETYDWRDDWTLHENFAIEKDTEGYHLPSAIAFVPEPGGGPKDPLYFVTELRGKVKVVTNDRTVHTFAEGFFELKPREELPAQSGEAGLAGICLDPSTGYVFVTFAYQDEKGILRNNIMRFDSVPGTFSLKPRSKTAFTGIFAEEYSSPSHQIGGCQVKDGLLYAGVGDAHLRSGLHKDVYSGSQNIDTLRGKVLRMTTDGEPVKDNPYYVDGDTGKARNYVWATGLRNPFGIKAASGRIYAADNGPGTMDRVVEIRRGENYLWDGTEWSIGSNAIQVLTPSDGVAQLDYNAADDGAFPGPYRDRFYLARTGNPNYRKGMDLDRGIVILDYDAEAGRMRSAPQYFVGYAGRGKQVIAGLAMGPDGLYFVPVMPDPAGNSAVLKVLYSEGAVSPQSSSGGKDVISLLNSHQCYSCHIIYGYGFGNTGPALGGAAMERRISERLASADYAKSLAGLDAPDTGPYADYREARKELMKKEGDERVKTWVKYHLMEPGFDNPFSQMPNPGLAENEAELIADYVLNQDKDRDSGIGMRVRKIMSRFIPDLKYRHLVYSFVLGGAATLLLVGVYVKLNRKK